jgi:hypothetical protein
MNSEGTPELTETILLKGEKGIDIAMKLEQILYR